MGGGGREERERERVIDIEDSYNSGGLIKFLLVNMIST